MNCENVCRHNKFGYCKFGQTCRKRHTEDICDYKDCEIKLCEKRHPRSCRFYSEFGRCKFGEFCRFKHLESSGQSRNDKEIEDLKALLNLKDEQILAVAHKIDTIVRYLKAKDLDELNCEIEEKIEFHELDEDNEFDDKMNYILENESEVKVFEEKESETSEYDCNYCENIFETEIRLVAHVWKDHRGKSTLVIIPRNPPP
jgi:hypothetical protein